ncbi:MAG: hypothetical protein HRT38_14150 [Alteromonadaceae bacterium]|nr:hypothetical protein [Alteromonadaceae bacterium]
MLKDNPWPGYLAIFPVLGSFLIIQAQRNDSLITSNVVFQKLGAWSYSIYLWHWPLVVAIYYFSLNEIYIYLGLALSVLLGFISNKYIEKIKFRNDFGNLFGHLKCKPFYMVLVVGVIGSGCFISNGFESHYPNALVVINKETINKNPYKCMVDKKFPCYIGNEKNIKAILVGDSHADALTTALAHSVDLKDEGIIALTMNSCPFILNIMSTKNGDKCYKENIRRMEYLESHYVGVPVFWVSRTGAYLYGQSNPQRINGIKDTRPLLYFTKQYTKAEKPLYEELKVNLSATIEQIIVNHPMYIVQPTPEMRRNIPKTLAKNIILNKVGDDLSIDYDLYFQRNKHVISLINQVAITSGIQVLNPIPYLCNKGRCMAQFEGRPIYYDGDHMSEYGNKILTPMFKSAVSKH